MAASTKVQLGARVSPSVREAAVARAKSEGVSLNVWVERTLGAALDQSPAPPGRTDAQDGKTAEGSRSMLSGPASRRAPATKAPAKPRVDWRQFS
jgi:hypothetical protein